MELQNQLRTFNVKANSQKEKNTKIGFINEHKVIDFLNTTYIDEDEKFVRMENIGNDNTNVIDIVNHKYKMLAEIKSTKYSFSTNFEYNKNKKGQYCFKIARSKIDKYDNYYKSKYPDYNYFIYYLFSDGLYFTIYNLLDQRTKNMITNTVVITEDKSNPNVVRHDRCYLLPKDIFIKVPCCDLKSDFPKTNIQLVQETDECLI